MVGGCFRDVDHHAPEVSGGKLQEGGLGTFAALDAAVGGIDNGDFVVGQVEAEVLVALVGIVDDQALFVFEAVFEDVVSDEVSDTHQ